MPKDITLPLILTIEETATYLRLPKETIEQKPRRRGVSKEELAAAVELMRSEYTDNEELTAFTALDGEDFYAKSYCTASVTQTSTQSSLN